jgi:hypothetical protein
MVLTGLTIEAQHSLSVGLTVKRSVPPDGFIIDFRAAKLNCAFWAFDDHGQLKMQRSGHENLISHYKLKDQFISE